MLNWLVRYDPFVSVLTREHADDVLDVGSGWHGLSRYWAHRVVQTDLQFEGDRPRERGRGEAVFVTSSAERLPFADDSFDYAISSDLMEHLPAHLRGPSIVELTRVARRGVLVGFPSGIAAARLDARYAALVERRGRPLPSWLQEHLAQERYPDRADVLNALPPSWTCRAEIPNANHRFTWWMGVAEDTPHLQRVLVRLERWHAARRPLPAFLHAGRVVRTVYWLTPSDAADAVVPTSTLASSENTNRL